MLDESTLKELESRMRNVVREEIAISKKEAEPLLTKKQIIEKLGCSYTTFRVMDAALNLPSHLVGRRPLFKESEVRESIKSSNFNQRIDRYHLMLSNA